MTITPAELCERLLAEQDQDRLALLTLAVSEPECVSILLARTARSATIAPQEALQAATLAGEIASLQQDRRSAALAGRALAQVLRIQGRHTEALVAFDKAVENAQQRGDSLLGDSLLGDSLLGDSLLGDSLLGDSLLGDSLLGDSLLAAQVQIGRIDSLSCLGRYDEAIECAERLLTVMRRAGAEEDIAKVQVNLGNVHYWRDHFAEALNCYEEASIVLAKRGDAFAKAIVDFNRATILSEQYRVEEAFTLFRELRTFYVENVENGMAKSVAMTDSNIGLLHQRSGQYAAALLAHERARQEFVRLGQTVDTARCDANLADGYRLLNLRTEALAAYERAIETFRATSLDYERGRAELGRASVLAALNDPDTASLALEQAEGIFRQQRNAFQQAHARLIRAYWLLASGATEEAMRAARLAARVFARYQLHPYVAEARFIEATISLRAGDNATRRMAGVLRVARQYALGWLECRAEQALGRYWAEQGKHTYALTHLRAGVEALEAARTLVVGEDLHTAFLQDKLSIYEDIVSLLLTHSSSSSISNSDSISKSDFTANSALKSPSVTASTRTETETETEVDSEQGKQGTKTQEYESRPLETIGGSTSGVADGWDADIAMALEYVERSKSRLLLDKVQAAMDSLDISSAPSAIPNADASADDNRGQKHEPEFERAKSGSRERLVELRAQLNQLYNQMQPQEDGRDNRRLNAAPNYIRALAATEEAYRATLRTAELEAETGIATLSQVATVEQLQAWTTPGEILIEFYIVRDEVCAFLLTQDRIRVCRELATTQEIEHLARRLRYHLHRAGSARTYVDSHAAQLLLGIQKPLAKLYDLLLRPLVPWLEAEQVTLVPHGVLHGLPFHAFFDSETSQYALDLWELTYAPSATLRYAGRTRRSAADHSPERDREPTALIMGVPDVGLEQIAREVEEISSTIPDSLVFCGETATLEAFYAHAANKRLIHLAAHALFRADNPLFSGLRFANGWLLARDLYGLRLQSELVILSACCTGQAQVESGDEMFGLLRGFLVAGARSVAVSLWSAEDTATATLMRYFYPLLAQGISCPAAMRRAQKEMRQEYPHPYQWAAFALFGKR